MRKVIGQVGIKPRYCRLKLTAGSGSETIIPAWHI
jgi:hypothetical protein